MPRRAAEGIELLADPTRRRIVALIAGRVRHPADIAEALELSRPAMHEAIIAWLAGVDLRRVRPAFRPNWSPPMRVHRLRHDARELAFDRDDAG